MSYTYLHRIPYTYRVSQLLAANNTKTRSRKCVRMQAQIGTGRYRNGLYCLVTIGGIAHG